MEKLTEQSLELSIEDDEDGVIDEEMNPLKVTSGFTSQRDEEIVMVRTPEKQVNLQSSVSSYALPTAIHPLPTQIFSHYDHNSPELVEQQVEELKEEISEEPW